MPSKMWDEITYPLLNFNGCIGEVWKWLSNFIPYFIMDVIILYIMGVKLIDISKTSPWCLYA